MRVYSVALVCLAPAYLLLCLCAHASGRSAKQGARGGNIPAPCFLATAFPLEPPQRRYPTPCGGVCPAPAQVARHRWGGVKSVLNFPRKHHYRLFSCGGAQLTVAWTFPIRLP